MFLCCNLAIYFTYELCIPADLDNPSKIIYEHNRFMSKDIKEWQCY